LNAYSLAQNGYGKTSAQIRTATGVEFEAFARVTRKLKLAENDSVNGRFFIWLSLPIIIREKYWPRVPRSAL